MCPILHLITFSMAISYIVTHTVGENIALTERKTLDGKL